MVRIVSLALLAALLAVAPARAGVVATVTDGEGKTSIEYTSPGAQRDDITITGGPSTVRFQGPGLQAGTGCTPAEQAVECPRPTAERVSLSLDAGDDRVIADASFQTNGLYLGVDAGDGDDVVDSPGASDFIRGEDGDDRLRGDSVFGGAGADEITGNGIEESGALLDDGEDRSRDVIRCGTTSDTLIARRPDVFRNCRPKSLTGLAYVRHRWLTYGAVTVPTRFRIRIPQGALENFDLTVTAVKCSGRGCMRARRGRLLTVGGQEFREYRFSGGVRVPGRRARGFRAGTRLRVHFVAGSKQLIEDPDFRQVAYSKIVTFTMRASAEPRVTVSCRDPVGRRVSC